MFIEKIRKFVKNSNSPLLKSALHLRRHVYHIVDKFFFVTSTPIYTLCRLIPLQNKIVASTFWGRKYGDNSQFILEELHRISPNTKIIWIKNKKYKYKTPDYVQTISNFSYWRKAFEYATSKSWLDTHRFSANAKKRPGQLVIETWHGGLGIKKIDGDVPKFRKMELLMQEVRKTSALADLFISNSDHLSKIYRSAFDYTGKIWKIGYPKNDILFSKRGPFRKKIFDTYHIPDDTNILLYAPTFRDNFKENGFNKAPYDINFDKLQEVLQIRFGGKWKILVRWHPVMSNNMKDIGEIYSNSIIDATRYPDMQELIMATDIMLSDYSSCIFDAAILDMPCFVFATDFNDYKQDRGVYYELEDLPFPSAKDSDELVYRVKSFNEECYKKKWSEFKTRVGLYETGHAAKDIAFVISEFIKGNVQPLNGIQSEP